MKVYARLNNAGHKLTLNDSSALITIHEKISLYQYEGIKEHWELKTLLSKVKPGEGFLVSDLNKAISRLAEQLRNIEKTKMVFAPGYEVALFSNGEQFVDEDGFAVMDLERREWWEINSELWSAVEAVRKVFPEFSPWLGSAGDKLLAVLKRYYPKQTCIVSAG